MKVRRRFFKVAKIFFKMFFDFHREYRLVKRKGYRYSLNKMKGIHEKRARELYSAAVSMGGVLIKLCQYLSARRDILPDEYIRILSPLQDSVPPVEFEEIEKIIRSEYGDYSRYYESIEREPLASASLGQVHRAVLHNGKEVVLKILKPDIKRIIDTDFAILSLIFQFLLNFKIFKEHADFINLLDEFIRVTGDELNFRREVYIAGEFRENLKKFEYLNVPYIYKDYCTEKIIVMEFADGDRVNEINLWRKRNNDPVIIAKRIIEIYAEQFLAMSLVHFDPHPGNILITDENNIALIDYGMAGEISERMRSGIVDLLEAFVNKDSRGIVDALYSLGFIRKGVNRYTLLPVVEFFFGELLDKIKFDREFLYSVDLAPIMDELVEIIYTQPFNIPFEWAYIGKTLSTIVGIISELNPDFNFYDELKPYAERLIRGNISEVAIRVFDNIKSNVSILASMPRKVNNFIDNLEMGYLKVKVDYTEISEKIDEVKAFAIKLISFMVSLISMVSSYIFYCANKIDVSIMFIIVASVSITLSLVYKKRSARDRIKKYF